MNKIRVLCRKLGRRATALGGNCAGQDMVEYALIGAFVVTCASALIPRIADSTATILSKCNSILILAQQ